MSASRSPKNARRHHPPTKDLQPRNRQAVKGGKKAVSLVKVTQEQIEAGSQELQSPQK